MDECPYCGEVITNLEEIGYATGGEFNCPGCGKPLQISDSDEGLWVHEVTPPDQAMRAGGAPTLPGLE